MAEFKAAWVPPNSKFFGTDPTFGIVFYFQDRKAPNAAFWILSRAGEWERRIAANCAIEEWQNEIVVEHTRRMWTTPTDREVSIEATIADIRLWRSEPQKD